jgi:hypothetical protein
LHEPICIDLAMDPLLRQRRSTHRGDDIFGWGYQAGFSHDNGSYMDLDDGFSRAFEEIADV